jgi:hypothetical protein
VSRCEGQHMWQMRTGKPMRCAVCGRLALPRWRYWLSRAQTRVAIVRGTVSRWLP